MPLSKERLGEIGILAWQERIRKEGMNIVPAETKRALKSWADSTGIPYDEAAEFWELGLDYVAAEQRKVLATFKEKK